MAEDPFSGLFLVFWIVMIFFYPRMALMQIVWKLEESVKNLEDMSRNSKKIVLRQISEKPTEKMKSAVDRMVEFFAVEPVSLDPYGIIPKLEHIVNAEEDKMKYSIEQITPGMNGEKRANVLMGVAGAMAVNQIAKIVKHFLVMIKKTKNIQLAMVLQMQLPMIERVAKAMYRGTEYLATGQPVGDSVGPLVAAKLIGSGNAKLIEQDTITAAASYNGRKLIVMKALGPGGRLGKFGRAVEAVLRKHRITRIITIDAAAKLEGEKTGSVAEGVGVAMGGIGVERAQIENVSIRNRIPLDNIVVKMSQEEAITAMPMAVKNSIPAVTEAIDRLLELTRKGDRILVIGVGNTSGVGNSSKDLKKTLGVIEKNARKEEAEKRKRREENKKFLKRLLGATEEED
ncbi:MAG: DUF1512 domain-containing protein [Candidatus Aenigmarchaeota archaeon]|nr:DUF1512 domain-containing protein [Candidatus Aenigmarchaeota archaeon]